MISFFKVEKVMHGVDLHSVLLSKLSHYNYQWKSLIFTSFAHLDVKMPIILQKLAQISHGTIFRSYHTFSNYDIYFFNIDWAALTYEYALI